MKFFLIIFLFSLSSWANNPPYVPSNEPLLKRGYEIRLGADFFQSTKPIDAKEQPYTFKSGETFKRYQGEVSGSYGFTKEMTLGVGARYRKNEAQIDDGTGTLFNANSAGMQSTVIHFLYGFPKYEDWRPSFEAFYRYVPYTNDPYSPAEKEQLVLGDDGPEMGAGVAISYQHKKGRYLTFKGRYQRPGEDLSEEIFYGAEGALSWKYIALVAGVHGIYSLEKDEYGSAPSAKPMVNTGNSYLYNSINRELLAGYGGLNIKLSEFWRVEFQAGQVTKARSSDLGQFYGIQLVRRVEKKQDRLDDKKYKEYDLEANVTKVTEQKNYVMIDKGLSGDVEKGMKFDLFESDYLGGNVLIASGVAVKVNVETSILKITQRFDSKKDIKEGLLARARVQITRQKENLPSLED